MIVADEYSDSDASTTKKRPPYCAVFFANRQKNHRKTEPNKIQDYGKYQTEVPTKNQLIRRISYKTYDDYPNIVLFLRPKKACRVCRVSVE